MGNKTFLAIIFLGFAAAFYFFAFVRTAKTPTTMNVVIEGKTYRLLTASSPKEWKTGLMEKESLGNADGMIFLFPDKQQRTFWNYKTILDLDVYWMDGDRIAGRARLPSIDETEDVKIIQSPGPVDRVVEIVR